jgi:hypothetical protein
MEDEADADARDSASRAPAGAYASLCRQADSGSSDEALRDMTRRAHLLRRAADTDRDPPLLLTRMCGSCRQLPRPVAKAPDAQPVIGAEQSIGDEGARADGSFSVTARM